MLPYMCHAISMTWSAYAVLAHGDRSAHAIFGSPDDLKFRSCMTLFDLAGAQQPEFRQALERFYAGEPDPVTVGLLA